MDKKKKQKKLYTKFVELTIKFFFSILAPAYPRVLTRGELFRSDVF